eukprot:5838940-Amphidinium_carterae.1
MWISRSSSRKYRLRPLPPSVRDELLGLIALWPDLECSLRAAPCPTLFASDASQSLAGVSEKRIHPAGGCVNLELATHGSGKGKGHSQRCRTLSAE